MSTRILEYNEYNSAHPQEPSEEQLLSEARSGSQQAFGELCLRYSARLRHKIFQIVRHHQDAEDIVQETFLKAYQHLETFRGACSFSTWLIAIGTNMSLMLLRKRKALRNYNCDVVTEDRETLVIECRDPAPDPEERYMMSQTSQKVNHAVRGLSPLLRNVLEMYYKSELRLKDAAKILGVPVATTKSRMLRARGKLRRSLKQSECWTPGRVKARL